MALEPSIILAGQAPNIIGAIDAGNIAGQRRNEFVRTNALNAFLQRNGPGIMAGDGNALAAYSRLDLPGAMAVQDTRQQMAARDQAMQMARQQAVQQAQAQAAQMTAEQRAQEAAQIERVLSGAASFYSSGDQAGYTAWLQQNQLDPAQYPFEQFPAIAATAGDVLETLKTFQDMNAAPAAPDPLDQIKLERERIALQQDQMAMEQAQNPPPPPPADPTELRKEWNSIQSVQNFSKQADAFGRMWASARDPSAAGDLALIYNFMKMLDPSSTVMAGEYANASNAGSVDQRVVAVYNSIVDGTRLDEAQRADFLDRAASIYRENLAANNNLRDQYTGIANSQGVDPNQAVIDYAFRPQGQVPFVENRPQVRPMDQQSQAAPTGDFNPITNSVAVARSTDQPLPMVRTDQDYAALPSGARFVDEDGKVWEKP